MMSYNGKMLCHNSGVGGEQIVYDSQPGTKGQWGSQCQWLTPPDLLYSDTRKRVWNGE